MNWLELKKWAIKKYYPALYLEQRYSRNFLHNTELISRSAVLIASIAVVSTVILPITIVSHRVSLIAWALFYITLGVWLLLFSVTSFYNSFYFSDVPDTLKHFIPPLLNYELARLLFLSSPDDLIQSFVETGEGKLLMLRAGILPETVASYLHARKTLVTSQTFTADIKDYITYADYAGILFDANPEFAQFLFQHGIQKKDLMAIADWITELEIADKKRRRWWSRDRLGRVPGIGKNWSYGQIYYLEKYSRHIPELAAADYEVHSVYGSEELQELEAILARKKEANAFLVSNDASGSLEIISRLAAMIEQGTVFPELEHKRIVLFDTDLLLSSTKTKGAFETEFFKVMSEAVYAGNVILVFHNFPSFVNSAQAIGSDAISLIDPYLTASHIQIIALTDSEQFHNQLERNMLLMQRFEKILITEIDSSNTVRVLQNEIIPLEAYSKIFFTYPALVTIADSAERYFSDGIMPDKAIDLLQELAPKITAKGTYIVYAEDVLGLIQQKTGIPVGEVNDIEKEKLLGLEKILHQRIIGQDEAVVAIANAVRRARSGINNPHRPLASFLFLGPTGVGKTETTKALADVFFEKGSSIERLDMSEYSSDDAVSKLIGSYEAGKAGVLASLVREHPYGVLLLDEFEKTTPEVMNLFLQILDEGFFSDMSGKKVNARNLLIIATSNAGSNLIWEALKRGENLNHSKQLIIDSVIQNHVFKPELINRFDGVIIFHPLAQEHLDKIARIQLEKLKKRLASRGVNLVITDDLVKYVIAAGTDPQFGARPMNRAIQDTVEQLIAEKLIRGDMKHGAEVALTKADFK